jgi:hypothetical protein
MDFAWSLVILSVLFIAVLLIAWILLHTMLSLFVTTMAFVFLTIFLRQLVTFSIHLTTNSLTIKKLLSGIAYLHIQTTFEKVLYNPEISNISFLHHTQILSIEDYKGFEVDCLLITYGNKWIEIGDATDSPVIFRHLLAGMDQLKIEKEISDIGAVKNPLQNR